MPNAGINNFIARGISALDVERTSPNSADPIPFPPCLFCALFFIDNAAAWSWLALSMRPSAL